MKNLKLSTIVTILLAGLSIFLFIRLSYYQDRYRKSENEVVVITDSLSNYKSKSGELYKQQQSYIADNNQLRHINEDLYKEVKNLKDNPIVVTKIIYKITTDTIYTNSGETILKDSLYFSNWKYSNEPYFNINGTNTFNSKTHKFSNRINSLSFNADMSVDIIEKDKRLSIIAKSTNPYLNVTNISGGLISPENSKVLSNYFKESKWSIGVGAGISCGYFDNSIKFIPTINLSIYYKLFNL